MSFIAAQPGRPLNASYYLPDPAADRQELERAQLAVRRSQARLRNVRKKQAEEQRRRREFEAASDVVILL